MRSKQIKDAAKQAVIRYAEKHGGGVARPSYRTNGDYARGFVASYCDDRRVFEIRVYPPRHVSFPSGATLALDDTGRIVNQEQ